MKKIEKENLKKEQKYEKNLALIENKEEDVEE
jgi:hypothetical protein